jgi:hypothetical protein
MGVIMAIFVAKESFWYTHDGVRKLVNKGETVRDGHPLYELHKSAFEPLKVDYDLPKTESSGKHSAKKSE